MIRWEHTCRGLACLSLFSRYVRYVRGRIRGVSSYRYDSKMLRKTEVRRTYASIRITSSVVMKKNDTNLCIFV